MAYLVKQTLEYSDGTSQVIDYTEVPVEALSAYEPLMDETPVEVPVEEVVEAPVEETPAETVTTDSPSVETAPVVETPVVDVPVEVAPEAPVVPVEAPIEAPVDTLITLIS